MKGYPNDLYILAFDHRGTLTKGLLGVEGRQPSNEEVARVSSMKDIIFDGFLEASSKGISGVAVSYTNLTLPTKRIE